MNYDVMIYALKVVRNHEFSGQVRMLSLIQGEGKKVCHIRA